MEAIYNMNSIAISDNVEVLTSRPTIAMKARENLTLMLKEMGGCIPSYDIWHEIDWKATGASGVFAPVALNWEEEVVLQRKSFKAAWMEIFLSRLNDPADRSYIFWALEVVPGEEAFCGQKWPDRLEAFSPYYGWVKILDMEDREAQAKELGKYMEKYFH